MLILRAAMLINYVGLYILQSYIIIYELVAANLSVNAATNVFVLIPFAGSLGQIGAGLVVKYIKRYKYVVVAGYAVIVLGMGLTYKYIDGHGQMAKLVVSQLILGIGQGMAMTTQFGMQAAVSQNGNNPGFALATSTDSEMCRNGVCYRAVHYVCWSGKCHWLGGRWSHVDK